MAVSLCLKGCCVCGSSSTDRCQLASWSAGGISELLALDMEVLLGSLWAHQMTQAPLVSVEVVIGGMGAGGVVQNASDRMGTASTAVELVDAQGRQGVLDVSTLETVMGELAELLGLWHIGCHWQPAQGEPCI